MCGIVGVFPLKTSNQAVGPASRRLISLYIHNETLLETVARGKDATGIALSFGQRETDPQGPYFWTVLKQPVDTGDFYNNDGTSPRYKGQEEGADIFNLMDVACEVKRPLLHILGHTRAKTVGSEYHPVNNHPILVGNIIGVHNGGIKNCKEIYNKHSEMTRMGEVDSEAVFQLLAENANDRALGEEDIKFVTERIVGPRAVFAYNRNHPEKVIYFRNHERPLELAYIRELGLAVICSEQRFLNTALDVYTRARMSLDRNLPELSCEWMKIPLDKGGVIDVSQSMDDTVSLSEMFPLVECPDVLDEYKTDKPNHSKNQGNGHKQGLSAPKTSFRSSGAGTSSGSSDSETGGVNTSKPAKRSTLAQAEVVDLSGYGAEKAKTQVVNDTEIMDDMGEDTNVGDTYTVDELCKQGAEWALGEGARDDENLLLNRHAGKFADYVSIKGVAEGDAGELVHQLYPEAFGEGYATGFRKGAAAQASSDTASDDSEIIKSLEHESVSLRSKLMDAKTKQRRAAAFIANMKGFLLAAIVTHGLGTVEENALGETCLEFDSDLEDFITTAPGFQNVSSSMVRELFSEQNLQVITQGFSQTAKMATNETAKDTRAVLKSIKN